MKKNMLKRTIKKNVYVMNYEMFIKILNNKKESEEKKK